MALHSIKNLVRGGVATKSADKVLIMVHGRGGSAHDILGLAAELDAVNAHLMAPQATNNTWYPYSFLAPVSENEPWLSSAITLLEETLQAAIDDGFDRSQVYVIGFSQGACLTLEFAARHGHPLGGVIAFTGGLIGDRLDRTKYSGDLTGTNVFIGNSDHDPHVPAKRSEETKTVMESQGALVTLKIYPNMPHTIIMDEINTVNQLFFR